MSMDDYWATLGVIGFFGGILSFVAFSSLLVLYLRDGAIISPYALEITGVGSGLGIGLFISAILAIGPPGQKSR